MTRDRNAALVPGASSGVETELARIHGEDGRKTVVVPGLLNKLTIHGLLRIFAPGSPPASRAP